MLLGILLLFLLLTAAVALWSLGAWNALLATLHLLLAGLIALNYFEPLGENIEESFPGLAPAADVVALWSLLLASLLMMGAVTFLLRGKGVQFILPVEIALRTVFAAWGAWLLVGFLALTLHTAPLVPHPLGGWRSPDQPTLMIAWPDRQWLALMQSRSRGALSRARHSSGPIHPRDDPDVQVFDPAGDFVLRYYFRRDEAFASE